MDILSHNGARVIPLLDLSLLKIGHLSGHALLECLNVDLPILLAFNSEGSNR